MKKKLIKSLALIMSILTIILPLSSCAPLVFFSVMGGMLAPSSFLDKAYSSMARLDSYSSSTTLDFSMTLDGVKYKQNLVSTQLIDNTDECTQFTSKNVLTSKITGSGNNTTTKSTQENGYCNGILYFTYKDNFGASQKIKSTVTAEEYNDYLNNREPSYYSATYIDVSEATTVEVTSDGDSKQAFYSSFSDFARENYISAVLGDTWALLSEEYSIDDVELTVKTDDDYVLQETSFVCKFSKVGKTSASLPTLSVTTTYSDIDSTVPTPPDLTKHKDVEALLMLLVMDDAMDERIDATNGDFTMNINTELTKKTYPQKTTKSNQSSEVTYGYDDENSFTFDVDITEDKSKSSISYEDGWLTYKPNSYNSIDMTDAEARIFIKKMMDPSSFSLEKISNVSVVNSEKGIYKFTFADGCADLADVIAATVGVDCTSSNAHITATIVDNTLTEYEFVITVYSSSYTIRTTYSFDFSITPEA